MYILFPKWRECLGFYAPLARPAFWWQVVDRMTTSHSSSLLPPAAPTWTGLLKQMWPDRPECIERLQEWFGLCLTPDTSHQRFLLIVGPPGSGKSTITRILKALHGTDAVVLRWDAMLGPFGLAELVKKSVGILEDVEPFQNDVASTRLLRIVGEDFMAIERRHRAPINSEVAARLTLTAQASPFIVGSAVATVLEKKALVLEIQRELHDVAPDLHGRLMSELLEIREWSHQGRLRLERRGAFAPLHRQEDPDESKPDTHLVDAIEAAIRRWESGNASKSDKLAICFLQGLICEARSFERESEDEEVR